MKGYSVDNQTDLTKRVSRIFLDHREFVDPETKKVVSYDRLCVTITLNGNVEVIDLPLKDPKLLLVLKASQELSTEKTNFLDTENQ